MPTLSAVLTSMPGIGVRIGARIACGRVERVLGSVDAGVSLDAWGDPGDGIRPVPAGMGIARDLVRAR